MGNKYSTYSQIPIRPATLTEVYMADTLGIGYRVMCEGATHQDALNNLIKHCDTNKYPSVEPIPDYPDQWHCDTIIYKGKTYYNTIFFSSVKKTGQPYAFFFWSQPHPSIF